MGKIEEKNYTGHDTSFKTYLWNPETKECMGRTGLAWAKLTIFYVIYYFGLAAFWGLCFYLFSHTLSDERPKWILDDGVIGSNPGMGFRPMPDVDADSESSLIWYKRNTYESRFWYNQLEEFVRAVDRPGNSDDIINCGYNSTLTATKTHACRVDISDFGQACTSQNKFGYDQGEPCILLKLNRIIGWEPKGFGLDSKGRFDERILHEDLREKAKDGMPQSLRDFIFTELKNHQDHKEQFLSTIWMSCEGETEADQEHLGPVKYYPENQHGIPGYYFPYYMQKGFKTPFIFIQLTRPVNGVLINVECKAWAKNIHYDKLNQLGSAHFEILID